MAPYVSSSDAVVGRRPVLEIGDEAAAAVPVPAAGAPMVLGLGALAAFRRRVRGPRVRGGAEGRGSAAGLRITGSRRRRAAAQQPGKTSQPRGRGGAQDLAAVARKPRLSCRGLPAHGAQDVRELRGGHAGAHPVRVHGRLPFHLPRLLHRACELSRGAQRHVAQDRAGAIPEAVPVLGEDLRAGLRHGRRVGDHHVLPVRDQLVGVLGQDGAGAGAADGLRGADRLLPGGRVSGHHAVRAREGGPGAAYGGLRDGGGGDGDLGHLDPVGEFVDAYAGGLRHRAERAVPAGGLVEGDLQPVVPLPARAYADGGVPDHSLHRGRRRGLAPAAGGSAEPRRADHVLHGHVDDPVHRAPADHAGRRARAEHAGASARQGHGHGGALPEPRGRRAADPVRDTRRRGGGGAVRAGDPVSELVDPQA